MPRFEVFCPASPPALPADVTLQLDAENWLAALKAGLQRIGAGAPPTHILCDVQADGSIHVAAPQGGGVFRIRELRDAPPSAGPVVPSVVARAAPPPGVEPAPAASPAPPRGAAEVRGPSPAQLGAAAELPADRQAGLERLLDLALERLDAEAGSVLLTRANGQDLEFVAVRGPRARELLALRATVRVGAGIVGTCVREGLALAVSDVQRDPRHLRAISHAVGYEARSILCAPIARKGHVLGAFEVLNKRGGSFGEGDLAALTDLARQAAEHLARCGG